MGYRMCQDSCESACLGDRLKVALVGGPPKAKARRMHGMSSATTRLATLGEHPCSEPQFPSIKDRTVRSLPHRVTVRTKRGHFCEGPC